MTSAEGNLIYLLWYQEKCAIAWKRKGFDDWTNGPTVVDDDVNNTSSDEVNCVQYL